MRHRPTLTLDDARTLIEGARREAEARALGVAIAVVDESGILVALERLDPARYHTPEVATRKARTAAIARTETARLQAQIVDHPAYLTFPDRVPIEGGIPVLHQGTVIGAIGCSGATSQEDAAICQAGLNHWSS